MTYNENVLISLNQPETSEKYNVRPLSGKSFISSIPFETRHGIASTFTQEILVDVTKFKCLECLTTKQLLL